VATGDNATVTDEVTQATVTKIVDTSVPGIVICIYDASSEIPGDITMTDSGLPDDPNTADVDESVIAVDAENPAEDAVACDVADENGDATFEGLEAGVDYVAVAQGLGFDQMTDAFNIAVPGTSETNTLTSALPGALTKAIDLGDFGLDVSFGNFSLNADVIFCRADLMDIADDGTVLDPTQCDDWTTDDAAVAHGGYDDYIGGSDFIFEFNTEIAPGDYVICSSAFVTGDFDGDNTTPDETVGYDFMCESTSDNQTVDGVATTGTITVYSEEETFVENDFTALAVGQLDVYVNDDEADAPIEDANVCLYDAAHVLVDCELTDDTGYASFEVPAGTYIVNVTSPDNTVYDDSGDVTVDYSAFDDASNGGLDDTGSTDGATADAIISLDNAAPIIVPIP